MSMATSAPPPAAIGVQLVQRQESKPLRGTNKVGALIRPGQDQLEHDVVGEPDVRRVRQDASPLVG